MNDPRDIIRFDLKPGETFTFDMGDRSIQLTASSTANSAIAMLSSLPESPERNAAIVAQKTIGNMNLTKLMAEYALLEEQNGNCGAEFGSLPVPTVRQLISFEIDANEKRAAKAWQIKTIIIGAVVGAFVAGFFGSFIFI